MPSWHRPYLRSRVRRTLIYRPLTESGVTAVATRGLPSRPLCVGSSSVKNPVDFGPRHHTCARTEAKLARPRTAPESAHRGIDNSDEFQIMIIFTLHAYRHRPNGTRAQEHNTNRRAPRDRFHKLHRASYKLVPQLCVDAPGSKPSARRGQYALHEHAIQAARLRDASRA